jgi:transposase-like protein
VKIEAQMKSAHKTLAKARENLTAASANAYTVAIAAYGQGVPITTIASEIGITTKTLYAWLRDAGLR